MPTPTKGPRLGGSPAHQRMILANLATNLFEHGRITTTEAKARRLRPFAERLISKARRDDLHHRRQVLSVIRDKGVVHSLFTEIGPTYATRPGGYTRITKIGPRKGDNAPMAVIELVEARDFSLTPPSAGARGAGAAAAAGTAPAAGTGTEQPSPDPATAEDASASEDVAADESTPVEEDVAADESTPVEEDARGEEAADTDSAQASDQADDVDDTDPGDVDEDSKG